MHSLPKLPYDYDALEPHIDARTMKIHHMKHHQGYVNNLNAALEGPAMQGFTMKNKSLEQILMNLDQVPEEIRSALQNNGGGHANHSLFWAVMIPDGGGSPNGELLKKIEEDFGSLGKMIEEVSDAAVSHFGSGWGWLVLNTEGKLEAVSTKNQDSPLLHGLKPILGIDVWEHAYYLNYQNRRADYVAAFWNVVNWAEVGRRFEEAQS